MDAIEKDGDLKAIFSEAENLPARRLISKILRPFALMNLTQQEAEAHTRRIFAMRDVNIVGEDGRTPLATAVLNLQPPTSANADVVISMLTLLVKECKAYPNSVHEDEPSALYYAVRACSVEVVNALIDELGAISSQGDQEFLTSRLTFMENEVKANENKKEKEKFAEKLEKLQIIQKKFAPHNRARVLKQKQQAAAMAAHPALVPPLPQVAAVSPAFPRQRRDKPEQPPQQSSQQQVSMVQLPVSFAAAAHFSRQSCVPPPAAAAPAMYTYAQPLPPSPPYAVPPFAMSPHAAHLPPAALPAPPPAAPPPQKRGLSAAAKEFVPGASRPPRS